MTLDVRELELTVVLDGRRKSLLAPLSFRCESGESVGFLGPSGSGKTTLFRVITGLDPRSFGTVSWRGVDAEASWSEFRRRVAYVPETIPADAPPAAWRWRAQVRELGRERTRYDRELANLGATGGAGGSESERWLSYCALALARDPECLLLEPPSSLFQLGSATNSSSRLEEYVSGGGALIVASSRETTLAHLVERVFLLFEGAIAAVGPTAAILPAAWAECRGRRA